MVKREEYLRGRIERIKRELASLGDMRPGVISRQYPDGAKGGRGYYQVSYTYRMKSKTEYVRKEQLPRLKMETATFRRFKSLVQKWIDAALSLSRERNYSAINKRERKLTRH
jgi:hypothetical protein